MELNLVLLASAMIVALASPARAADVHVFIPVIVYESSGLLTNLVFGKQHRVMALDPEWTEAACENAAKRENLSRSNGNGFARWNYTCVEAFVPNLSY